MYAIPPGAPQRLFLLHLSRIWVHSAAVWRVFWNWWQDVQIPLGSSIEPASPGYFASSQKLREMERRTTDVLRNSLLPGQKDSLKTRPDGTILDGHHRIYILRGRGVDVDALPREIIAKGDA
jgi:hypothetical protein